MGRSSFFGGGVGGGVCVSCQPIYRSLPCSILFLNFLYKRLREGKRRVSEKGEDGRRKKVPSWISSRILCQSPKPTAVPKSDTVSKKRTFLKRLLDVYIIQFDNTRFPHTQPQRCMPHLLCYFLSLWTLEVMLGQLNGL